MKTLKNIAEFVMRNPDKIDSTKHQFIAVSLWQGSFTTGIKVALFYWNKTQNDYVYLSTKFYPDEIIENPIYPFLEGSAAKTFLSKHGYRIKQSNKTLIKI